MFPALKKSDVPAGLGPIIQLECFDFLQIIGNLWNAKAGNYCIQ